ncbi:MAG: hypothetical protein IJZ85_00715 [Lachnospiraceae bacterium]|nr:hypothetical protein [Lachnospiraceae bacterium]
MKQFPFPDRITARDELTHDVLYKKIPEEERVRICDEAWQVGVDAARREMAEDPDGNIYELAKANGLQIIRERVDKVSGGLRFFSEYTPNKSRIDVYVLSIRLFAKNNHLTEEEAEELILAHEFFHFLEENKIGDTSQIYTIPRVTIGSLKIGKSGIRALSEIGAHGFARTYWEISHGEAQLSSGNVTSYNNSMEARMIRGKHDADQLMSFMFGKKK